MEDNVTLIYDRRGISKLNIEDYLIVAAIDIGTTKTACGFSTQNDFENNPINIQTLKWEKIPMVDWKTSSCILFDKEKKFHSYGNEAEEKFAEILSEKNQEDWFCFRRFKNEFKNMELNEKEYILDSEDGKTFPAQIVFTAAYSYLKEKLLSYIRLSYPLVKEEDIKWIITVSAMWPEKAKMFMRECLREAGFHPNHFTLVMESEAAALYANYIEEMEKDRTNHLALQRGLKYLICDIGGGSVDATVFEMQPDETIKELFASTGGDWCGSLALQEYLKFLERLFGNDVFKQFRLTEPGEVLEMYQEFRNQTRITSIDIDRRYITLWIPASLHKMFLAKKTVEESKKDIDLVSKIYRGDISLRGNKLKIGPSVFRKFFEPSIYKISGYLHNILRHPNAQDVEVILLVGGFSDFTIITDPITNEFSSYKFIIPKYSGVSVLVGALIFGHNPVLIQQRVSNYTYGCVAVFEKQFFSTDESLVGSGNFDRLVEIGHPLESRSQVTRTYYPNKDIKNISIYLYGSTKAKPVLVNDKSCFYLGSIALRLPEKTKEKREVQLEVSLKGSMIELTLVDSLSGKSANVSINTSYKVHSNEYLLVGAIDFGTTYSGYAFSSKHDYDENPTSISSRIWTASSGQLQSLKIPTCALFTPEKTFHSFGYEAEDKYASLSFENKHHDWYFFRRFKMKLYNEMTITDDFPLESLDGRKLSAVLVFGSVIRHLREELLSDVHFTNMNIHEYGLRWVITVPAIWTDASKNFMRKCALQAGIDDDRLVIALEPEAAAMYSNFVAIRNQESDIRMISGTKYLVCDAGGGTVDITVHELIDDEGHVRELYKASGGNWGGTSVDEELLKLYEKILGEDVMAEFNSKHPDDALELARELETKKRSFSSDVDRVSFTLPLSLQRVYNNKTGNRLSMAAIASSSLAEYVTITGERIRVTGRFFLTCFDRSIAKIVYHLKEIFRNQSASDVGLILLVGGYAESAILQKALQSAFPSKKLLVPKKAGLSVLKGAVIFGHDPYLIIERKSKYTYGIRCRVPFVNGKHRKDYKKQIEGEIWCENVFSRHVTIDDTLIAGKTQSTKTYKKEKDANSAKIAVFASLKENPTYITDAGCFYLGGKVLEFENGRALGASCLEVQMAFGGTEIELTMTCKVTGRVTKLHLENDRL